MVSTTLYSNRKVDMKVFRENEGSGKAEIDGPAAIEDLSPKATLRPHSRVAL